MLLSEGQHGQEFYSTDTNKLPILSYLLHVGRKWKGGIVSDCSFLGTVNEVYITCTGA